MRLVLDGCSDAVVLEVVHALALPERITISLSAGTLVVPVSGGSRRVEVFSNDTAVVTTAVKIKESTSHLGQVPPFLRPRKGRIERTSQQN